VRRRWLPFAAPAIALVAAGPAAAQRNGGGRRIGDLGEPPTYNVWLDR
jgi:hypothetical protein